MCTIKRARVENRSVEKISEDTLKNKKGSVGILRRARKILAFNYNNISWDCFQVSVH